MLHREIEEFVIAMGTRAAAEEDTDVYERSTDVYEALRWREVDVKTKDVEEDIELRGVSVSPVIVRKDIIRLEILKTGQYSHWRPVLPWEHPSTYGF